jgi:hypothetical protein
VDIICFDNEIDVIDVTRQQYLRNFYCGGNRLAVLDVSVNYNLWNLYVNDMPTLFEVCVWEEPFPPENVMIDLSGSPNVYFTTNCLQ